MPTLYVVRLKSNNATVVVDMTTCPISYVPVYALSMGRPGKDTKHNET